MDMESIKRQIDGAFAAEAGRGLILCCSCGGMDKRAKEAFSLLFPTLQLPEIIRGRDRISKLAAETGNAHIKAIGKVGGKFAYYIYLDSDDKITMEYDLLKGTRIA